MGLMNFIANSTTTKITAAWLNKIDVFVVTLFGEATDATGARTAISAAKSGANTDITSLSAPALGAATATTQGGSDSTTKVATTAMVQAAIALISFPASFPSGTRLLFNQTSAPTGWTKETNSTYNDKCLRVITGTVSTGGSTAFSSVFGSGKTTGNFTLTSAEIPAHSHVGQGRVTGAGSTTDVVVAGNTAGATTAGSSSSQNTGGGGAHNHSLSLDLQYVDVIICSKD